MSKNHSNESRSEKASRDNRSNQLNPNNDAYWTSRGYTTGSKDGKQ